MGSSEDLFVTYNTNYSNKVNPIIEEARKEGITECYNLGPPKSGKTTWGQKYLSGKCTELTIGFTDILTQQIPGNNWAEKAVNFLKSLSPLIKAFLETEEVNLNRLEKRLTNFNRHELQLIREYLSETRRLPKLLMEHLNKLGEKHAMIIYYIPWEINENLTEDVKKAVDLVRNHFVGENREIRWLGKKYIPPGLVKEIIDKAKTEGWDKAEKYVEVQAEAYKEVNKLLVGEGILEFKGFLTLSFKEFLQDLTWELLTKLFQGIQSMAMIGLSAAATGITLAILHKLTEERGEDGIKELIMLKNFWNGYEVQTIHGVEKVPPLNDSLKGLIAANVALQLGITPDEALEAINEITGLDVKQLEKMFEELRKEIEELKKRMEQLENLVKAQSIVSSLYTEPSQLHIEFKNGEAWIKFGNLSYKFVDPEGFTNLKEKVANVVNKVKEAVNGGKILIVRAPHGVGKSTFVNYLLAKMLKEGEIKGVIDLATLDERLIPSVIERANGVKRYVLLYDPSTPLVYEMGGRGRPRQEVMQAIAHMIENIFNLMTSEEGEVIYSVPVIIVIPDEIYNVLSKDVRERIENVEFNVSDRTSLRKSLRLTPTVSRGTWTDLWKRSSSSTGGIR
uniref:hypothetical protein n=1 Tax=Sulfolobus sp. NOB8H2 TaxID=84600 RepID=UPI00000625D5|nr:hypothetical protein [Sulfolobus sp. NOB8H2]CAA09124.1 hypothetical protein [Sulfolobus sp. NOB8H2]